MIQTNFVDNPPEPLESIPGRARIVDAAGNPIDPDNPPVWEEPATQPAETAYPIITDRMHGAHEPDERERHAHLDVDVERDEGEREHKGGKHARTVHQRRSRTSE